MTDIILKTLITFFCIYGLTDFLKNLFSFFLSPGKSCGELSLVIKVLNSEKTLEATIRMIIWKTLSISRGNYTPHILIVDMGSSDLTPEIAKRLSNDYSFIDYLTYDEYLKKKG